MLEQAAPWRRGAGARQGTWLALLTALGLGAPGLAEAQVLAPRDAYGAPVAFGVERVEARRGQNRVRSLFASFVEAGLFLPVGYDGDALKLLGRLSVAPDTGDRVLLLGYRGYFGHEGLRTFWDIDLALTLHPQWTAGPRLGFGLQYEVARWMAPYLGAGAQVGGGQGLRFSTGASLGALFRFGGVD